MYGAVTDQRPGGKTGSRASGGIARRRTHQRGARALPISSAALHPNMRAAVALTNGRIHAHQPKDPIAGAVQNQGVLMAESNDGLLGLFASANGAG